MKVTIKDKEALLSIGKDDLLTYLEKKGWEFAGEIERDEVVIGTKWKKYNNSLHKHSYVKVVLEDLPDYSARMAENLMEIEQCEDESQIQIYVDITGNTLLFQPWDVFDGLEDLDISIGDGISIVHKDD